MVRFLGIALLFLTAASCGGENEHDVNEITNNTDQMDYFKSDQERISYCIGLDNGNAILNVYEGENTKGKFSIPDIQDGIVDYLSDGDLRISIYSVDSLLDLYLGENGAVNELLVSKADASYAIGLVEGQTLVGSFVGRGIDQTMEIQALVDGIIDGMMDKPDKISYTKARNEVAAYYSEMNEVLGRSFLDKNSKNPNVITTESGLQYEVIVEGTGISPKLTDTCMIHYTGRFIDGRVFESTIPSKQPVEFTLINVIEGWQEGLRLMKEGGSSRLYIPYHLAYGETGSGPIEPYSTLVFDIELLRVNRFKPN